MEELSSIFNKSAEIPGFGDEDAAADGAVVDKPADEQEACAEPAKSKEEEEPKKPSEEVEKAAADNAEDKEKEEEDDDDDEVPPPPPPPPPPAQPEIPEEHRDLEARIAQIIKSTEETQYNPEPAEPRRRSRYAFQTRPYNEDDGEEAVMDDEELHSLLGV